MAKSPLTEWGPPPDLARAFRLVGEFMWHWASLEAEINRALHKLLKLDDLDGVVLTANVQLRDKLHVLRTLNSLYCSGELHKKQSKALTRIGDMTTFRNIVAHNEFADHESGGVEFYTVKAKGKFELPDEVWTVEMFLERYAEINRSAAAVKEIAAELHSRRRAIEILRHPPTLSGLFATQGSGALGPQHPLGLPPQPPQSSPPTSRGKSPRKRTAHPRKGTAAPKKK